MSQSIEAINDPLAKVVCEGLKRSLADGILTDSQVRDVVFSMDLPIGTKWWMLFTIIGPEASGLSIPEESDTID